MQAIARLDRYQMQWPLFCLRCPQPLDWRLPLRMRGKIGIAITGDFLAEQLNLAARRLQRIGLRIRTKIVEKHEFFRRCRQLDVAFAPEILKLGPFYAGPRLRLAALLIDRFDPGPLVAVFGELLAVTEPLRQIGKNIKVVTCLMLWRNGLMHRQYVAIAR
ncbi:hypothetical protein D3C71_1549120 [compost metagenome]